MSNTAAESVIRFESVHFEYPAEETDQPVQIFDDLTLDIPGGLVSLVGENGIGKSTLLLLAGARIFPQSGSIELLGRNTSQFLEAGFDPELEEQRNKVVSFVYQNMEFETEEPIGALFDFVHEAGAEDAAGDSPKEVIQALGLSGKTDAKMQELSKGEQQRAIIAMSLLYGSQVIMMDEPVFAVEPDRADKAFDYLQDIATGYNKHIYFSAHDIELTRRHAESVVLFHHDGRIEVGPTDRMLERETLEQAFRAPYDTLYRREKLYRDLLNKGL